MKIFIADYLPLANKGEEEILRGIETLYSKTGKEKISFTIFGDVEEKTQVGNIVIFPKSVCYPEYTFKGKTKTIMDICRALLGIAGIYPYHRKLKKSQGLIKAFQDSDVILIGHDGFFNIRCAMLGNYLKRKGYQYGILGAGFNRPGKYIGWVYDTVYKRCFNNAKFVILREKTAYNYVKDISNNIIIKLFPDPAFFCPSDQYDSDRISRLLPKYNIGKEGILNIGMTVCEDSISFSRAFVGVQDKKECHRKLIANLITEISKHYKCSFYFLPHCIKEGKGNDLIIAKDIVARLDKGINCNIIEDDMPVLDLKYLISKMDIMIGERTHSIINSIATATPFISLTCSADFRTHDIVGDGCNFPQQVYDLDNPNDNELFKLVDKTITEKKILKKNLKNLCESYTSMKLKLQDIL